LKKQAKKQAKKARKRKTQPPKTPGETSPPKTSTYYKALLEYLDGHVSKNFSQLFDYYSHNS
jgi:hypothetical protein